MVVLVCAKVIVIKMPTAVQVWFASKEMGTLLFQTVLVAAPRIGTTALTTTLFASLRYKYLESK